MILDSRMLIPCVFLLAVSIASAQVKLPPGDGKELVQTVCSACHDLQPVVASNRTEAEWREVVDDMASRGADADADSLSKIVKYLAKYFGKASNSSDSKEKASGSDGSKQ